MGQSQSQQQSTDLYANYITQQQELIRKQQQQINSLYRYNMNISDNTPPNVIALKIVKIASIFLLFFLYNLIKIIIKKNINILKNLYLTIILNKLKL